MQNNCIGLIRSNAVELEALSEIGYDGVYNLEIPGESRIPIELRDAKLSYIKTCFDYLLNSKN